MFVKRGNIWNEKEGINMIKAEKLLNHLDLLKPGSNITFTLYRGYDILQARLLENQIISFMKTGELLPFHRYKPIPAAENLGLDILSYELAYDDDTHEHTLTVDGTLKKLKEE